MKATIGLFANDQTACFDRMWAEVTNSIAAASGADANMLKYRAITRWVVFLSDFVLITLIFPESML